jgi:DNA invertase Pin-like site-specific DNA recombinase
LESGKHTNSVYYPRRGFSINDHSSNRKKPYGTITMETTVSYIRTATLNPEQLHQQQSSILEYVQENNLKLLKQFQDIAVPGSDDRKDGLKQMLEYIKVNDVDGVIVYSLNRFGRDTKSLLEILFKLKEYGTKFITLN